MIFLESCIFFSTPICIDAIIICSNILWETEGPEILEHEPRLLKGIFSVIIENVRLKNALSSLYTALHL